MGQYVVDWSRRWTGTALAVARPGSTDEVRAVLRACADAGVPVVPQGGNTGLVGGSVPQAAPRSAAGRALHPPARRHRRRRRPVRPGDRRRRRHARRPASAVAAQGWAYGVDLAARDSATIGGTVATNAGGIHVIAYGMTRAQVVGIEAVLPDGSVISHLSGMLKDNTGYDLAGAAVRVGGHPRRHHRRAPAPAPPAGPHDGRPHRLRVLRGRPRPHVAGGRARGRGCSPRRCSTRPGSTSPAPRRRRPGRSQSRHPVVLLLEVVDGGDASGFAGLDDRDVIVGLDAAEQARLWSFRERQAEAFSSLGHHPQARRVGPAGRARRLRRRAARRGGRLPDGARPSACSAISATATSTSRSTARPPTTTRSTSRSWSAWRGTEGPSRPSTGSAAPRPPSCTCADPTAEIAAMRAIKGAWDPQGLMNPGVIFSGLSSAQQVLGCPRRGPRPQRRESSSSSP